MQTFIWGQLYTIAPDFAIIKLLTSEWEKGDENGRGAKLVKQIFAEWKDKGVWNDNIDNIL